MINISFAVVVHVLHMNLQKELGYYAGFGACKKYADDVATFAVTDMVKRGFREIMKKVGP